MNFKKLAPSAANWFFTVLFSFSQREVAITVRVNISEPSICSHTSASRRPNTVPFFLFPQYNLAEVYGGCFMVTATHVGSNVWRIGPLNIALRSLLFTPLPPPTECSFSDGRLCQTFFFFFLHQGCRVSRCLQRLSEDLSFAGSSFWLMSLTAAS